MGRWWVQWTHCVAHGEVAWTRHGPSTMWGTPCSHNATGTDPGPATISSWWQAMSAAWTHRERLLPPLVSRYCAGGRTGGGGALVVVLVQCCKCSWVWSLCVYMCVSVLCTYGCECYCFEWVCCLKGVCVLSVCLCECVCEWVFTCVVFMCEHACFYVCCVRVQTNMCVCMSVHANTTLSNVHLYRNHRPRFWWQTLANNPKIQCSANLITGVLRGEQR